MMTRILTTSKTFLLLVTCLLLPVPLAAQDQSRPWGVAYETCAAVAFDHGYEIVCAIRAPGLEQYVFPFGSEPVWSPDGQRIAVASGGTILIYTFADGTMSYGASGWDGLMRWSPDSARLAFVSYRDGAAELYVMNADGSAQTRLTHGLGVRPAFAWSPDGTRIAFAATADDHGELFVMGADGSNPTRLTFHVGSDDSGAYVRSMPSWSPDGSRIAFDCAADICTIEPNGVNFTTLTAGTGGGSGALFSPVDARIAFLTGRFGGVELVIMAADGSVTRMAPGLLASQHAWSPDGGSLAFVNFEEGYACPSDGSCFAGQYDVVTIVNSDGTGLNGFDYGHYPTLGYIWPGQPVAAFSSSCAGAVCQFDGSASYDSDGSIVSYSWDFGDGLRASGASAAHTYAIGQTYEVRLSVTDDDGRITTTHRTVTANAPPIVSLTIACNGPTCTFDASGTSDPDGTIQRYAWNFGDGSSIVQTVASVVTHIYRGGTFSMTMSVTDNAGAVVRTEPRSITIVNQVPVAVMTVSCVDLTCTFDASASQDDGELHYSWSLGNSQFTVGRFVTHTYGGAGTYTATLSVWDTAGAFATTSNTFGVGPAAPPARMHVGDLDATITNTQKSWSALLIIRIERDNTHEPVSGVTITGTWNDGTAASCVTSEYGTCSVVKGAILRRTSTVTFSVIGATHSTLPYASAGNHDRDGDSNGTTIVVKRP